MIFKSVFLREGCERLPKAVPRSGMSVSEPVTARHERAKGRAKGTPKRYIYKHYF